MENYFSYLLDYIKEKKNLVKNNRIKKKKRECHGDALIGKSVPSESIGPEFKPQYPHKKPGMDGG